jgi:hypothetical protein
VNSLEIGGVEKYLVVCWIAFHTFGERGINSKYDALQMQEFGPNYDAEVLQNKKRLEACDVLVFVYDSGDVNSFAYVANLLVSCLFYEEAHGYTKVEKQEPVRCWKHTLHLCRNKE